MEPWYNLYPERFQAERDAFTNLGIAQNIDEQMLAKGILRMTLTVQAGNPHFAAAGPEEQRYVVVYPDSYPWFRPQIFAPDLNLPRHQNPMDKNLCLLPRKTEYWQPEQTAAALFHQQFPLLITKGGVTELSVVAEDPTEQAEPRSDYYPYLSSILFDPDLLPPLTGGEGPMPVGFITVGIPRQANLFTRMAVTAAFSMDRNVRNEMSGELCQAFPESVGGVLIRLAEPPPVTSGPDIYQWLEKLPEIASLFNKELRPSKVNGLEFQQVIGLQYRDETVKGTAGTSWLFLVRVKDYPLGTDGKPMLGKGRMLHTYCSRPVYISADARKDRVPKLLPLVHKKVALIGLGALGGFAALELARSGVGELRLMDNDYVDPPTTVRWPLGLSAAGILKIEALAHFIRTNYPFTTVVTSKLRLGDCSTDGNSIISRKEDPEPDQLESFLKGVDLLIDATAEIGINHFLSYFSWERRIPLVSMYATPGAWGGVLMRSVPGSTGCWYCMKKWQEDLPEKYVPPVDSKGEIQPPGCGDITFTGAGFDLQQVALASVRMAVGTLCRGEEAGYPDVNWDWAILKLVDEESNPIPPQWTTEKLEIHPECPYSHE